MGLDNYAVYGKEHPKYDHTEGALNSIPNEFFPNNNLCGGMFSGGGNSFRGKVYDEVVQFFTNYTLYEDILEPDQVREIATMLNEVTEERFNQEFAPHNGWEITYNQVQQLAEWFHIVAEEDGSVISWY
jgi:hypothetical protein